MKKKVLSAHNEAVYHLINFRINQFTSSKKLLKMDYLSFMICSVVATHILYKNMLKNKNVDWDEHWKIIRTEAENAIQNKRKLSIFAISEALKLPKESVRRKLLKLVERKLLNHSTKYGVVPGINMADTIKPFAKKEIIQLSGFLKALKKHKALEQVIDIKEKDLE